MIMSLCNTNYGNRTIGEALGQGKNVYFVGIGGIGMQSLALLLKERGYSVSGSDARGDGEGIIRLRNAGIAVDVGHRSENIGAHNLVVFTLALSDGCPELLAAKKRGILTVSRAELLGFLMSTYPHSIAVAGTHGKSTTTGMLATALAASGKNPTVLSGAPLSRGGMPICIGGGETAVCEACEYKNSFHAVVPEIAVALNLEWEHTDWFPSLSDVEASFCTFLNNAKTAVVPSSGGGIDPIRPYLAGEVATFGLDKKATSRAENITWHNGCAAFSYIYRDRLVGLVQLSVPGMHNLHNALAALCAVGELGADLSAACTGIGSFYGVEGRLERRGIWQGMTVYADYAHHPTEIAASLATLRMMTRGRLICIYQPHTYSRTAAFFDGFVKTLSTADRTVLLDIYAAREQNESGVTSAALAAAIPNAVCLPSGEEVLSFLIKEGHAGDTVVFMGAGSITELPNLLSYEE